MSDPFIGEIRMVAFDFAPRGWAMCDGQLVSISQNPELFSLLGDFYGGDARSNFGLPDMRGRVPIHQGQGPGMTVRYMGQPLGTETVQLNQSEMPQHTHEILASSRSADSVSDGVLAVTERPVYTTNPDAQTYMNDEAISPIGGGQSHSNMMPYLCLNYIICLSGYYPERS